MKFLTKEEQAMPEHEFVQKHGYVKPFVSKLRELDAKRPAAKLLELLTQAEEHHCLTVVRMAMKDLRDGKDIKHAHARLFVDADKLRCSQTTAGKALHEYVEKAWKEQGSSDS